MRFILVLLSTVLASSAWAKTAARTYDSDSSWAGKNSVGGDISGEAGGLAIGADYEYALKDYLGVGGYLHYFPKSTHSTDPSNGQFMIGGRAAVHYIANSIDAYAAPGMGFISINSQRTGVSDSVTFGPSFGLGLMYQVSKLVAVGIEENSYWVWLNSDFDGMVMNDFALRVRFTF